MPSCRGYSAGKIPFLILPAGDITYLLREVLPTQWQVNIETGVSEVTSYGGMSPRYISGLREVSGDISFVSEKIEVIDSIEDISTGLDGYSVTDLLRAVNKKLRAR